MKKISEELEFINDIGGNGLRTNALIVEEPDKDKILEYLKGIEPFAIACGKVKDNIKGIRTDISIYGYEQGDFRWNSEHIYYFEHYNIKLTDEFLKYVRGVM